MKNVKILINLLLALLIILITGCDNRNKKPFLYENSCDLPCWNGNYQGLSTKEEFLENISSISIINQETIISNGGPWDIYDDQVFFEYSSDKISGNGLFNQGILTGITFEGDLDSTIGELIEQIGPPDFVINVPIISGNNVITFIYRERGISYAYGTTNLSKKMSENLEPEIPIEYIHLFDPGMYDQMVKSGLFGQGHLTGELTIKYLIPWSGYGPIQSKYPPAKW